LSKGGYLLWQLKRVDTPDAGYQRIAATLKNGEAANKFRLMLVAHGVDEADAAILIASNANGHHPHDSSASDFRVLPKAKHVTPILSKRTGRKRIHRLLFFTILSFVRSFTQLFHRPWTIINILWVFSLIIATHLIL